MKELHQKKVAFAVMFGLVMVAFSDVSLGGPAQEVVERATEVLGSNQSIIRKIFSKWNPKLAIESMERLGGGKTNTVFRVKARDPAEKTAKDYVIKYGNINNVPYDREFFSGFSAGNRDAAPKMIYHSDGALIYEFVSGANIGFFNPLRSDSELASVANLLKKIQTPESDKILASKIPERDLFRSIADHLKKQVPKDAQTAKVEETLYSEEELLQWKAKLDQTGLALCHGDFHGLNIIQLEEGLRAIDWEYGAKADRFWDLSYFVISSNLTESSTAKLIQYYLGRAPTWEEKRRIAVMMQLARLSFHSTMWKLENNGKATLGSKLFDFYLKSEIKKNRELIRKMFTGEQAVRDCWNLVNQCPATNIGW